MGTDEDDKGEMDDSGCVQDGSPPANKPTEMVENGYCGQAQLLDLSDDVLLFILKHCSPHDLKALGYSCTRLGALIRDRTLWQTVDARGVPSGCDRLHWMLNNVLHEGTTELLLTGYAREARGCLGHVYRTRHGPETKSGTEVMCRCGCTGQIVDLVGDEPTTSDRPTASNRGNGRGDANPGCGREYAGEANNMRHGAAEPADDVLRYNLGLMYGCVGSQQMSRYSYSPTWSDDDCEVDKSEKCLQTDSACAGPQFTLTPHTLRDLVLQCPKLTSLSLQYCNINCRKTTLLQFPKTLRSLSLRGTKCYNLPKDKSYLYRIHEYLPNLQCLDVSECDWMEPASLLPLSKMTTLNNLIMRDCHRMCEFVAYASLATRYGFRNLKMLDLRGSPVGDSEVSSLGFLRELQELYLSPAGAPPLPRAEHSHPPGRPLRPHVELQTWEMQPEPGYRLPPPEPSESSLDPTVENSDEECRPESYVVNLPQFNESLVTYELRPPRAANNGNSRPENENNNRIIEAQPGPSRRNRPEGSSSEARVHDNENKDKVPESNDGTSEDYDKTQGNSSNAQDENPGRSNYRIGIIEIGFGPSVRNHPYRRSKPNYPSRSQSRDNNSTVTSNNENNKNSQSNDGTRSKSSKTQDENPGSSKTSDTTDDIPVKRARILRSNNATSDKDTNTPEKSGKTDKNKEKTDDSNRTQRKSARIQSRNDRTQSNDRLGNSDGTLGINYKTNIKNRIPHGRSQSKDESGDSNEISANFDNSAGIDDNPRRSLRNREKKEINLNNDDRNPETIKRISEIVSKYMDFKNNKASKDDAGPSSKQKKSSNNSRSLHSSRVVPFDIITSDNEMKRKIPDKCQENENLKKSKSEINVGAGTSKSGNSLSGDSMSSNNRNRSDSDSSDEGSSKSSTSKSSTETSNNSEKEKFEYVRFRRNQEPVLIREDDETNRDRNENFVQFRQREPIPRPINPEPRNQDIAPRHHILYVNVGQQLHSVYRLLPSRPLVHAMRNRHLPPNMRNMFYSAQTPQLDAASLVTDSAVRRFGRSDGVEVNYVNLGANGPYAARDPSARPERSNLRVLSITGFRNITDRSLVHLATSAPHLRRIDFSNTSVTAQGVENFKSLRPNCEVIFCNYEEKNDGTE